MGVEKMGRVICAAVMALGLMGQAALAQTPPPAAPVAEIRSSQEIADEAVVQSVVNDLATGGYAKLVKRMPDLAQVMSHAPKSYPKVEARGSAIYIRAEDSEEATILTVTQSLLQAGRGGGQVYGLYNVYPTAALLMGSMANEVRQLDDALKFLDAGLAIQPDHNGLVAEKAVTLGQQRKFDEAYRTTAAALTRPMPDEMRARLLRANGFALIELKRLDEAQKAYEDSLKLVPNHAGARNELAYIAQLRKGGKTAPIEMLTADKAANGDYSPPK